MTNDSHKSAGGLNNARYQLDFSIIPKILFKDPTDFITRCQRSKGEYICALFNRFYEFANSVFFFDRPKHFDSDQFTLQERKLSDGRRMLHITLPSEHEGSLVYCTDYVILYEKKLFGVKNAASFTIERHLGGTVIIGSVDDQMNHVHHDESRGSQEADLDLIRDLAVR